MIQYINLLTKRNHKKGFFWLAVWVLVAIVVVLLGMAAVAEVQLQRLREAQSSTQRTVDQLQAVLEQKRREAGLAESEAMGRQIALLRSQIDARREWADLLQKGELGTPSGYSQWFETLAGLHEDGVWLQGVDIAKGGQSMSITGNSTHAEAVMRYIGQVNEAFKPMGIQFSSIEINRDLGAGQGSGDTKAGILHFKLY